MIARVSGSDMEIVVAGPGVDVIEHAAAEPLDVRPHDVHPDAPSGDTGDLGAVREAGQEDEPQGFGGGQRVGGLAR